MFSKIRPHVVRWVSSSAAAPQALVDGEAVVAMANASRIADLKKNNAAVDFTWNQGIASIGYFGIPRGAKHYKNAMRFIDYVARAEPQAAMAKLSPFGPVNRRSFDLIGDEVKRTLTSYPENKAKQLVQDEESWSSKSPSGLTYYEQNIKMWNEWVIR
jgi:putative spermidine/putrescine transport system substrate-binding protein